MTAPLSVVIPAYQEEARLGSFLDEIAEWVAEGNRDVEVIVVDDGSTDHTVDVAHRYDDRIPGLTVIGLLHNQGKGAAVRRGFAEATAPYRVFLDADGSTPVAEVQRLMDAAHGRNDVVVIGSIAVDGAEVGRDQVAFRHWAGRAGNWVIRILAVPGIHDTQRGCKLVSERWCREVLPACTLDGWAFDVEMLARSRRAGYLVREIPVHWHHVDGTKVTAKSYLQTLADVARLRLRLRREPVVAVASDTDTLGPAPNDPTRHAPLS